MLPYLHLTYIGLGPVKIYAWGFFVSLGFLIAYAVLIKKYPQDKDIFTDLLLYILIGSMIGARLFFILFYLPPHQLISSSWWGGVPEILAALKDFWKIWQGGMSSFGGLFGGALAIYIFARVKKINFFALSGKIVFVLPLGLAIARIGCYLINDHPGIKTFASPLSVAYPDGPRYDLGFLMMVFNILIFAYFLFKKRPFFILAEFLIIYGVGRFLLDFLRVGEPIYAGLIPSQYGSIIMIATGLYLIKDYKKYVS